MVRKLSKNRLFHSYFKDWVELYKVGAVRDVTLNKYNITYRRLKELAPDLKISQLNRMTYQKLINDYALTHEKQTTMDFHHQVKAAILDAVDEGLIERDPTRKAVIKGKNPGDKKQKYLNQSELQTLISTLELKSVINRDWFILLVAKTGLRFSEALALTPNDFDFKNQTLSITKSWNYKNKRGGFIPTKNESSNRKIQLDWQTCMYFSNLTIGLPKDRPMFIRRRIFNSTINDYLKRKCTDAGIPVISIHGLRHTHASLLLFAGVSIASVSRRLGHSNITTTQQTYLHIIRELENKDNHKMMQFLATIV
ncbi:site-specific integrase [Nosocomiicoccus ampullae]|nr:site-specific integrase [Nosocomiicoccus ampullae]QYA46690.1 site-specific integrase [Nosocomiicoccus ampullae]